MKKKKDLYEDEISIENYIEIYERQNVRAAREFVKIAQENLLKLLKENPELISKVRHGHGRLKLGGPFLITSIPVAYIAGSLNLNEFMFQVALLVTLILVAIRIYFFDTFTVSFQLSKIRKWIIERKRKTVETLQRFSRIADLVSVGVVWA